MRRKLTGYTVAMLTGITACLMLSSMQLVIIAAVALALVINFNKKSEYSKYLKQLMLFFVAGIAVTALNAFFFSYGELSANLNHDVTITGQVYRIEEKEPEKYKLYILTKSGKTSQRVLVSYYSELDNYYELLYQTIQVHGELKEPDLPGNPHTFNYRNYLKSKKIPYILTTSEIVPVCASFNIYEKLCREIIKRRELFISNMPLDDSNKAIVRGILFGDTNQVDDTTYEEFQNNSTAHVLAVSGLHIGILFSIYKLLRKRIRKKSVTIGFLAFLFIYDTCALWSVSVLRATVLVLMKIAGDYMRRRYDITTALSFICMVQMAYNPYIVFATSFQMSYLAVALIIFTGPKLEKTFGDYGAILGVQLGFIPYMIYTFNFTNLLGVICNIPVVFLISMVVPIGIATFVISQIVALYPNLLYRLLESLLNFAVYVNHAFANQTFLSRQIPSPPLWCIVLIYLLLFFFASEGYTILSLRKMFFAKAGIVMLCAVISLGMFNQNQPFDDASLIFVDVGQGDCLHLTDKGFDVLFDGGGKKDYDVGAKVLMPYLLKNGYWDVDAAFATHLHMDHYQGLCELAEVYPVKALFDDCTRGEHAEFGDSKVSVLWPLPGNKTSEDENLSSSIFMIEIKGIRVLVTGDITEEGEKMLLDMYGGTGILRADVLKIAHHGSRYSSSGDFLDEVSPEVAVISVGANNHYGHPADETLKKLEERGIRYYRTDQCGAVGIIINKDRIRVVTNKGVVNED